MTDAGDAGIRVYGNSIIRNNRVTGCGKGLHFTGSGALADGNLVFDNTDNYDFAAGNQLNLLLSQIPESLDWPCSVKLAGSLTTAQTGVNGIMVNANDVFIDLAGHTLSGPGATSKSGIYQSDARSNAGGGISVGYGCTVYGCTSKENAGEGIAAASRNTLENCTVTLNKGHGVVVYADNVVRGCGLSFNGYNSVSDRAGLYVPGPDNRIDGNNATNNDRGIEVVSGGNFITRNTASGNTTNWKLVSGNVCLVVQAATSGAINGNSGGTAPGSTDPNANFTF